MLLSIAYQRIRKRSRMTKKKKKNTTTKKKIRQTKKQLQTKQKNPTKAAMKEKVKDLTPSPAATTEFVGPIKMAVWGASPYVITGFGEVMRQIMQNLFRLYPKQYEVFQVGINFVQNSYDESFITGGPQNGSYKQWPANMNLADRSQIYGQKRFLDLLRELLAGEDLDMIFLFEDPFIVGGGIPGAKQPMAMIDAVKLLLKQAGKEYIPIVAYYPIDGRPKLAWLNNISKVDFPITYLNFGKRISEQMCPALMNRVRVIPHGVDLTEFHPVSKAEARMFKRAMFGDRFADKFMFLNVNRNQLRKLIPSTLIAFKQFQRSVPESFIYLNMKAVDVGWNLFEVCQALGLRVGEDVIFPHNFEVQKGLTLEDLNLVFNCADALVSSACGGGWELSLTQAFSTKTTVIAPANTSHIELCGAQTEEEARGILYKSGSSLSQTIIFPHDNDVPRPLPDLDDMVQKMLWAYHNQDKCREMEERAYNWVDTNLNWSNNVVPAFNQMFQIAAKQKRINCGQMVVPQAEAQPAAPSIQQQSVEESSNIFVGSVE
jgi:glycosyltransferase involved in cell wall biosynthesis